MNNKQIKKQEHQEELISPSQEQIKYRAKKWAKALRENKRKARSQMRDNHGGRCCLQVAEDVAIQMGLDIERSNKEDLDPKNDVARFFGWEDTNPFLKTSQYESKLAGKLNDGEELVCGKSPYSKVIDNYNQYSHKEIAEAVLNTFVRKIPKDISKS